MVRKRKCDCMKNENEMPSVEKQFRLMEIFFRGIRGEQFTARQLADEYHVSTKTILRDISDIRIFLSEHVELLGTAELLYSTSTRKYAMHFDEFFSNKEMFAIIKILIGSRAIDKVELLQMIDKLKKFSSIEDRKLISEMILKENYHYHGVMHQNEELLSLLWQLAVSIRENKEITVKYHKMDKSQVERRIRPVSVIFTEYYFYLIAYDVKSDYTEPKYFRVDRITNMTIHRDLQGKLQKYDFDEGELREQIQFMFPGKLRKITFEFSGPSVQAILDRLPTAKILQVENGRYTIQADVYGEGIKMYLLSQGSWVKVIGPEEFVEDMKEEIRKMWGRYDEGEKICN